MNEYRLMPGGGRREASRGSGGVGRRRQASGGVSSGARAVSAAARCGSPTPRICYLLKYANLKKYIYEQIKCRILAKK